MPTPISISSSARSKVGLPAAGTVQLVSAIPIERVAALTRSPSAFKVSKIAPLFRGGSDDFLHDQRAGNAAPSGRKGRGLHGHVVIGNNGRNRFSDISRAISKFMTSPS